MTLPPRIIRRRIYMRLARATFTWRSTWASLYSQILSPSRPIARISLSNSKNLKGSQGPKMQSQLTKVQSNTSSARLVKNTRRCRLRMTVTQKNKLRKKPRPIRLIRLHSFRHIRTKCWLSPAERDSWLNLLKATNILRLELVYRRQSSN